MPLSGPIGAGKTTVARELIALSPAPLAYIEGDIVCSFPVLGARIVDNSWFVQPKQKPERKERKVSIQGKFAGALLAALLLASQSARADQLVMKNGDKISGTIQATGGGNIVIQTDYAGKLTVKLASVAAITATQPLHVTLASGQTLAGRVAMAAGEVTVSGPPQREQIAPMSEVAAIRNDAEQAAYEKSLHPAFTQKWNLGANVGFALTRGNSETSNLALAFTAVRQTQNDKISAYANSVYATNDAPGANPSTTADTTQGGIRYDHNLNPRVFWFTTADFMSNGLQDLDLRSAFAGGLGYHAIHTPNTTLDLLLGGGYTHETYTTATNNYANLTAGEEFARKIAMNTTLTQSLYFFPDLNQAGEYRATGNFGGVTKINKWLGWQTSFADIYVSNPPGGAKQNDIIFTTGLNVSFLTQ